MMQWREHRFLNQSLRYVMRVRFLLMVRSRLYWPVVVLLYKLSLKSVKAIDTAGYTVDQFTAQLLSASQL